MQTKQTKIKLPETVSIVKVTHSMAYPLFGDGLKNRLEKALYNRTIKNTHTGENLRFTEKTHGKNQDEVKDSLGRKSQTWPRIY